MSVSFSDRVAIVTGAGGGLGRQYAILLASRGCKVRIAAVRCPCVGEGNSASPEDCRTDTNTYARIRVLRNPLLTPISNLFATSAFVAVPFFVRSFIAVSGFPVGNATCHLSLILWLAVTATTPPLRSTHH